MMLVVFSILHFDIPRNSTAVGTYEINGWSFEVYDDEMPLYVDEIVEVPPIEWSCYRQRSATILCSRTEYFQRALSEDSTLPMLEYTVTEINFPILYQLCKRGLLNSRQDEYFDDGEVFTNHYEAVDAAPWGAREAYQVHWSDSILNKYLLCYETHFVEISFDWEPTTQQMAIVGEKLANEEIK